MHDSARIKEALHHIPPDIRETWLRVGMALKNELGDAGLDIWLAWGNQAKSYNHKDALAVWRSIHCDGGIAIGTLFYEAKTNGWRDDGAYPRAPVSQMQERRRKTTIAPPQRHDESKRAALRKVWDGTIPTADPRAEPLRQYLRNRGLGDALGHIPKVIRFHPNLDYWVRDANNKYRHLGQHSAMVCRVDNLEGRPVSILRIYLTKDGQKARVPSPKKLMPPALPGATSGGAIRLYPAADTLAVTEGVETALAVRIATRMSVWACISAGGMAALKLPKEIRQVRILMDLDRSGAGELAAMTLAQELFMRGVDARIVRPQGPIPEDTKSVDWLDILQEVAA